MEMGLEALRRFREKQQTQTAQPEQRSLLAQVPVDARYEKPNETLHVWHGDRWIPFEKWLAIAGAVVDANETKEA